MNALKIGMLLMVVLAWSLRATGDTPSSHEVTIDFSTHSTGEFPDDFYKKEGIVFTEGWFVGFIQGDDALVGPIAGTFTRPIVSLSVRVAPASQGTAEYTLTAFRAAGDVVGTSSITVTQDTGDPETSPFGYVTIDLALATPAKHFTLKNKFIRSSFPQDPQETPIEFGVSSLTYKYK